FSLAWSSRCCPMQPLAVAGGPRVASCLIESAYFPGGQMPRKTVRIAMNGVTGRMGYRQHLVRSILAIREDGGLDLGDGTVLWPEPVLVGRREHALKELADRHGLSGEHIATDLSAVLADPTIDIYFDAQ